MNILQGNAKPLSWRISDIKGGQKALINNCEYFAKGKFIAKEGSSYEFVDTYSNNGIRNIALVVTTCTGDYVQKDTYFFAQGNRSDHELWSQDAYFPLYNNDIMIHATAVYVRYYHGSIYIRPIGVTFSYIKSNSVSVTNISVTYVALGYVFTYPGYVSVSIDPQGDSVTANVNNPSPSTDYNATNVYPTDRVMYCDGGVVCGQSLNFSYTMNGQTVWDSIQLGLS